MPPASGCVGVGGLSASHPLSYSLHLLSCCAAMPPAPTGHRTRTARPPVVALDGDNIKNYLLSVIGWRISAPSGAWRAVTHTHRYWHMQFLSQLIKILLRQLVTVLQTTTIKTPPKNLPYAEILLTACFSRTNRKNRQIKRRMQRNVCEHDNAVTHSHRFFVKDLNTQDECLTTVSL